MPTLRNNVRFSKKTMEHRPFHWDYCNTKSLVQHQYSALNVDTVGMLGLYFIMVGHFFQVLFHRKISQNS